ncbi:MAG: hypothetical protein AABZ06_15420 [Bdellovibrionota bacterium]
MTIASNRKTSSQSSQGAEWCWDQWTFWESLEGQARYLERNILLRSGFLKDLSSHAELEQMNNGIEHHSYYFTGMMIGQTMDRLSDPWKLNGSTQKVK